MFSSSTICFIPHTVIISTYTAYLMVSTRPVLSPLREELMRLCASQKDSWRLCGAAAREPGGFTVPSHHARHQSLTWSPPDKEGNADTGSQPWWSYAASAHAAAMCSLLPVWVAEHMRPTPRSHRSSSLTPQPHMSLTDRPSVCFPLQDEVHFLCSLCFRPEIKKRSPF